MNITRLNEEEYEVTEGSDGSTVTVTVTSPTETVITDQHGDIIDVSPGSSDTVGGLTISQADDGTITITDDDTGSSVTVSETGLIDDNNNVINIPIGGSTTVDDVTINRIDEDTYVITETSTGTEVTVTIPTTSVTGTTVTDQQGNPIDTTPGSTQTVGDLTITHGDDGNGDGNGDSLSITDGTPEGNVTITDNGIIDGNGNAVNLSPGDTSTNGNITVTRIDEDTLVVNDTSSGSTVTVTIPPATENTVTDGNGNELDISGGSNTVGDLTITQNADNSISVTDGLSDSTVILNSTGVTDGDGNAVVISTGGSATVGDMTITRVDGDTFTVSDGLFEGEVTVTVVESTNEGDSGSSVTDSNGNEINLAPGQSSTVGNITVGQTDDGSTSITDNSGSNITVTDTGIIDENGDLIHITPGTNVTVGNLTITRNDEENYTVQDGDSGAEITVTVPESTDKDTVVTDQQGNPIDTTPGSSETVGDMTLTTGSNGSVTITDESSGSTVSVTETGITNTDGDLVNIPPGSSETIGNLTVTRIDENTYVIHDGSSNTSVTVTVPKSDESVVTDVHGNPVDISSGGTESMGNFTVSQDNDDSITVTDDSGNTIIVTGDGPTDSSGNPFDLSPGENTTIGDVTVTRIDEDTYVVTDTTTGEQITVTVPTTETGDVDDQITTPVTVILDNDTSITKDGDDIIITNLGDGSETTIGVNGDGSLDVGITAPKDSCSSGVSGMSGSCDGDINNEIQTGDGEYVDPTNITSSDLNDMAETFADSGNDTSFVYEYTDPETGVTHTEPETIASKCPVGYYGADCSFKLEDTASGTSTTSTAGVNEDGTVTTFDGITYTVGESGEFTLVNTSDIDVSVWQVPCGETVCTTETSVMTDNGGFVINTGKGDSEDDTTKVTDHEGNHMTLGTGNTTTVGDISVSQTDDSTIVVSDESSGSSITIKSDDSGISINDHEGNPLDFTSGDSETVGDLTVTKSDNGTIVVTDASSNSEVAITAGSGSGVPGGNSVTDNEGNVIDISSGETATVGDVTVSQQGSGNSVLITDGSTEITITASSGDEHTITDSNGDTINLTPGQTETVGDITFKQVDEDTFTVTDISSGSQVDVLFHYH
ncbi:unnamed protein product [Owenia fusiformis]|uniref:Uncharacterized protein n=1 Tax=Owenia fusiformis TaxID=6347 RepID=A0A8S4N4Q8_OWEFU|nr:unnamed protein product [Owenia fusiformis]